MTPTALGGNRETYDIDNPRGLDVEFSYHPSELSATVMVNGQPTDIQVEPVYSPNGEIESFRPVTAADSNRLEQLTGATIMSSEEAGEVAPTQEGTEGTEATNPAPDLPADPDDLLEQGYIETSHPDAAANGHRTFENPETGETVRFDEGEDGANGHAANDHYHVHNPDATGNHDMYLDENGNPVAKGSAASHIYPD